MKVSLSFSFSLSPRIFRVVSKLSRGNLSSKLLFTVVDNISFSRSFRIEIFLTEMRNIEREREREWVLKVRLNVYLAVSIAVIFAGNRMRNADENMYRKLERLDSCFGCKWNGRPSEKWHNGASNSIVNILGKYIRAGFICRVFEGCFGKMIVFDM